MRLHHRIEDLLGNALQRWRWLRFLRRSIVLATVVIGLVLLLGLGMVAGLVVTAAAVTGWLILLFVGAAMAWMGIVIDCAATQCDRTLLAASVEEAHSPLMDRLNTLVELQRHGKYLRHPYAQAIESQARNVIAAAPPLRPFSPAPVLARLAVLAALATLTLLFYGLVRPWEHLKVAQAASPQGNLEDPLDIPPPESPADQPPREDLAWGEIRFTRPGGDVRAGPQDIVSLEIEVASNQPLKEAEWLASVVGEAPRQHPLPPPKNARSAVYYPGVDLKAFGAKEGDLVSYFARAASVGGNSFESELYFVEVAPPRGELKQTPVSRDSPRESPSQGVLERVTDMMRRQAEVIRQTRRQAQLPDQPAADRKLDREALAREEGNLGASARHLAADAQGALDVPARSAMDKALANSASKLSEAQQALSRDKLDEALPKEMDALAALSTARKQFHSERLNQASANLSAPTTADAPRDSKERLGRLTERMDEMRDRQRQLQAAREAVKKMLTSQRDLQLSGDLRKSSSMPQAARRQRELQKSLEEFGHKNSACLGNCQNELSSAQRAMGSAADVMQGGSAKDAGPTGRAAMLAGEAGAELQNLDDALEREEQRAGLAAAYQLKRMLDHQIGQLVATEQSGLSAADANQDTQRSKTITGEMKALLDQRTIGSQFGQPLRDALDDSSKQKLDALSDQLADAEDSPARRQAANALCKALSRVAQVFEASCPRGVGRASPSGPRMQGRAALEEGLRQLQGLVQQPAGSTHQSQGVDSQTQREALANLAVGLADAYGSQERAREVLGKVEEELKEPKVIIDVGIIEDLLRQIQSLAREVALQPAAKESKQTHIDSSRLPPAYRRSIEKYFEILSEQR